MFCAAGATQELASALAGNLSFASFASLRNRPSNGSARKLVRAGNCFVIVRLMGIGKSSGCKHEC